MKKKRISSKREFVKFIQDFPNSNLSTIIYQSKGTGIVLSDISFNFSPNPIIYKYKANLFSDDVLQSLNQSINKDRNLVNKNIESIEFHDCTFDDSVKLFTRPESLNLNFSNCIFSENLLIPYYQKSLSFTNGCKFQNQLSFERTEALLKFEKCFFDKEFNAKDVTFYNKCRFHQCEFKGVVNFNNSVFKELADFWGSSFNSPITFYKTEFNGITVFSAVTFKNNVLFTYTLIDKLIILRGAKPKKGFDISLAIVNGRMKLFDFQFNDYSAYSNFYKDVKREQKGDNKLSRSQAYEIVYERIVSSQHEIPIENKRETYRILKNQHESQKNYIDSIPFKVKESKTLLRESWQNLVNGYSIRTSLSNIIVLVLNSISNWFGSSYILGGFFTLCIAGIFFNSMLSHIGNFSYTSNVGDWQWEYFVKFLNPVHKFDFMDKVDSNPEKWFYIYDFVGRIFVSYGIYQTVQAFRKFK